MNDNPQIKFVIAPHEMDESRIERLITETRGGALRYTQCTPHTPFGSKQLLILDTVGILASVYGYATWAISAADSASASTTRLRLRRSTARGIRPQLSEIQGGP